MKLWKRRRPRILEVSYDHSMHSSLRYNQKHNYGIGALFALKRKKMLEKEVAKLDGQMTLLEQ